MVNNYIGLKKIYWPFGFRVQIYGIFVYAAFCYVTYVSFYVSHTKMHASEPLFYRT